jgi:Tol biopolymer transport system component
MMNKKTPYFTIFLMLTLQLSCSNSSQNFTVPEPLIDNTPQPVLTGKMVYHSYSCYNCNDSVLFLYDFSSNERTVLSQNWGITNPMNAHFSPDGKKIVFMGVSQITNSWDLFIYTFGVDNLPINLTVNSLGRDEDPKFSPDGTKIIYKRNGIMKEMDTAGNILHTFTVPNSEASMPYYTADGKNILFAGNESAGSNLNIYKYSISNSITTALSAIENLEEYYPIVIDNSTFLFTRWESSSNKNDQVYLGYFDNETPLKLPFNEPDANFSDAYPVNSNTLLISSTKQGGIGQYDLYLADMLTGKKWSLNLYNPYINSNKNELGGCYSPL